jgi:hypothetical protein
MILGTDFPSKDSAKMRPLAADRQRRFDLTRTR